MPSEIVNKIKDLESRADELRTLLKYAPRAFVMEFAGTPKSGKSTSVEAIRHFFSRHGFRVHVLAERAAVCPIPMKGHLFFNTWCAASMLAELLANVETETDIVIIDRGLFDALVWLKLQKKRGELTAEEARAIESFLLLKRWEKLIDLAVVMNVSAEEALSRESSQRISSKVGSIMNKEVLSAITSSVDEAIDCYKPVFSPIIKHETTGQKVKETNVALAERVLEHLESFLNPEILVIPRKELEALPPQSGGSFDDTAVDDALGRIVSHGRFMRRAEAESKSDYVQIVSCGLLEHKDQMFLFQRKETDPKYRLYGKTTIWQGCHVPKQEGIDIPEIFKTTLQERISRLLFLSRIFPIERLGYCWDKADSNSSRHFGIVHKIHIDNPHTAVDLKKKEFKRRRGHGFAGQFHNLKWLVSKRSDLELESWSQTILNNISGETK